MVFGPAPFMSVAIEDLATGDAGDEIHFHAAGQGVWVARAAARLGAHVRLVTTSGGEQGALLNALLAQEPIVAIAVPVAGEGGAYIDDRRSGERRRIAERPADPLSRHEQDDLYGVALSEGLNAGVAVLCGTGERDRLQSNFYRRLSRDLRSHGTLVVADLSGELARGALEGGLDVLKMNESEARELMAGELDDEDLVARLHRLQAMGAERVVVSRAEEPALALDEQDVVELTAPRFEEADHRGAGDSMTAALAVGLAAGEPWRAVLATAAAAGAANVTRHGLGTASAEHVRALEPRVQIAPRRG
jgi:1-phosphofructokinase